jgi:hypothetical protein
MAFAEEGSAAFSAGAFDVVQSIYLDEPKVADVSGWVLPSSVS